MPLPSHSRLPQQRAFSDAKSSHSAATRCCAALPTLCANERSGLASGDVYVVQWQRGWYEGTLGGGAGTLTGQNHGGGSEQKTIGASNSILEMDVPQRPDPDTSDNTLQLVPVDAGMDCAGLIAAGDGLF